MRGRGRGGEGKLARPVTVTWHVVNVHVRNLRKSHRQYNYCTICVIFIHDLTI